MIDLAQLKELVTQALENAGYDIAEGRADLLEVLDTERLYPAFETCFGNNPAAPYIVPAVPHASDEPYDYGDSMRSPNDKNLYWTHRLEDHEALVVFGNLPPEGAFIGYENFHFTRYFDGDDPASMNDWLTHAVGVQHHLSPTPDNLLYDNAPTWNEGEQDYDNDPNRVVLFANGSTINRRTLEKKIGTDFWGKLAIFSTSADAGFKDALDAQLRNLHEALPTIHAHNPLGEDLKMGLTDEDDDFWTLMRYAVPRDGEAADKWRENVANELVVFRVKKPGAIGGTVDRHPVFQFEEKTAKTDERDLAADLQKVADAVSIAMDFGEDAQQEICIPLSMPLHKPTSLPMAMSAVGATNDADYRVSSARPFGEKAVLAVVGVNHTQTENSTYVSLGIYDAEKWLGIRAISQALGYPEEQPLYDSVEGFFNYFGGLPDSIKDTEHSKFYVHIVAREDADLPSKIELSPYITTIVAGTESGELPLTSRVRITERAYLNPDDDASCGPDYKKLLSNIVIAPGTGTSAKPPKPSRRSSR